MTKWARECYYIEALIYIMYMLIIRLQRTGKRNRPDFRIIVAEKKSSASKKFLEILGSYNPRTKALELKNKERLQYWVSQHLEISPTAHNLLVTQKLLDAKKVRAFNVPKKPAVVETTPVATENAVSEPVTESSETVQEASTEQPAA